MGDFHGLPPYPQHSLHPKPRNTSTSWNLEAVIPAVSAFSTCKAILVRKGSFAPGFAGGRKAGLAGTVQLVWLDFVPLPGLSFLDSCCFLGSYMAQTITAPEPLALRGPAPVSGAYLPLLWRHSTAPSQSGVVEPRPLPPSRASEVTPYFLGAGPK